MSGIASVSEYGKYIDLQNYTGSPVENSGSIVLSGSNGAEIVYFNRGLNSAGSVEAESSFVIGSADLDETDMEKLDGITNGTVAANKAVVVDGNKDATGFRNVTMTGDMTSATITNTGFTVASDGATALKSLAVDDSSTIGCDSDTDLMSLAAGALTVNGTLSADTSFTLDSTTLDATELGYLDGVTAGTAAASKALVLDANSTVGTIYAGTLTNLTATYAKIERLDVSEINSVTRTETTLEVSDKLILAASGSNAANSAGGGLQIGGTNGSDTVASMLYDNGNSALDFNLAGTTQVRLQDGVFRPETDNDVDLGASGAEFKDLYLDGVAYIDDLRADALGAALNCASQAMTNINVDSGVIDGTVIGGNSAAAGTFTTVVGTTVSGSGALSGFSLTLQDGSHIGVNGDTDLLKLESGMLEVAGEVSGSGASAFGSLHCDSVNLDGGNIDGTIIGAASAAAGTFTALVGTSLSVSDGNITNVADIALDSISADGTSMDITLTDNESAALEIKEGSSVYMKFDTSNGDEHIVVSKMFEMGDDGSGVDFKVFGGSANHFMLYDASENRLEFSQDAGSSNHITIGGDANGEYAVDVADGSNAKNKIRAAAFVTYSDERLKTDVAPIEDALKTVNSLNAVNFTWKKDGSRDFGFMAQELKRAIPQAVHGNEEGLYGVDYGRLTSVLVAAIQEQSAQINALKAKLEDK